MCGHIMWASATRYRFSLSLFCGLSRGLVTKRYSWKSSILADYITVAHRQSQSGSIQLTFSSGVREKMSKQDLLSCNILNERQHGGRSEHTKQGSRRLAGLSNLWAAVRTEVHKTCFEFADVIVTNPISRLQPLLGQRQLSSRQPQPGSCPCGPFAKTVQGMRGKLGSSSAPVQLGGRKKCKN
jgi:hypothetical protein